MAECAETLLQQQHQMKVIIIFTKEGKASEILEH